VGIALHPEGGQTLADLGAHAEEALCAAKRSGKRRVAVYP
jgi:hypothetical protein